MDIPSNGVINAGFTDLQYFSDCASLTHTDASSIENIRSLEGEEHDLISCSSNATTEIGSPRCVRRLASRESSSSVESFDTKSSWNTWDVFRAVSKVKDVALDDPTISRCRKAVKVIVGLFMALCVLACALISKASLLLISSNIYVNVTSMCNAASGQERFCSRAAGKTSEVPPPLGVVIGWVWAMFGVVVAPCILTFIRCLWTISFKKCRNPKWTIFLVVLLCETLHCLGVSLFAFIILPGLDSLRGLILTVGVAFIPSILKPFDKVEASGRHLWTYILDLFALSVQASILLFWPIYSYFENWSSFHSLIIPVALILVSFGHWENYINRYTRLGRFGNKLKELKKNARQARVKTYLVTSLWKTGMTLIFMTVIVSGFHADCAKSIYFLNEHGDTECSHFVYPRAKVRKDFNDPIWVMLVQAGACLVCYTISKTACKILLQVGSFALPLILSVPVLSGILLSDCHNMATSVSHSHPYMPAPLSWNCDINVDSGDYFTILLVKFYCPIWVAWWLSFVWVTSHIWFPSVEKLAQTERIFVLPLYCGVFLEQFLVLNRRRDDKDRQTKSEKKPALLFFQEQQDRELQAGFKPRASLRTDITPMIYVCATMWHETEKEMVQVLTSIFRLDLDQCTRKNAFLFFDVLDPSYYEFEAHIFFDDAFEMHEENEQNYMVNTFVKSLVKVIDTAASAVHRVQVKMSSPTKYSTPYGGRLEWMLPGHNKLSVHLKDKTKIRHKKRWSQVMYMYYFLGHRLVAQRQLDARRKQVIADNTYILALDGDVDFQPSSVQLLVDRMKKNEKVGAACGRIHPIGSGPMVWYQKFEYAVSHWLQKATEHMIGSVLCSPGCFSLFRASALMDDNVMRRYATTSTEARHYVQYDQGEDRWLCTLLLQQGYRVEYCAAADALTYCPESFYEFYNQRRRWSPSTMANIMDLLMSWRLLINKNENFSTLYVLYQLLLFVSSLLTPATTFLLIVGAFNTAFKEVNLIEALFFNLAPIVVFLVLCLFAKTKVQVHHVDYYIYSINKLNLFNNIQALLGL